MDRATFSRVVRELRPNMVGLAVTILEDQDDAADVVQTALLRVYAALDSIRDDGAIGAFLLKTVRNQAIDFVRAEAAERSKLDNAAPYYPKLVASAEPPIDLPRALARLAPTRRAVVTLSAQGYSPSEIAARLGIGASAAKMRLHRARNDLREAV